MKEQTVPFKFTMRGALTLDDGESEEGMHLAQRLARVETILNRAGTFRFDLSNLRDLVEVFERLATIPARARASAHSRR